MDYTPANIEKWNDVFKKIYADWPWHFLLTALMSTLSGLHNLNRSNTSLNGMNQEVGVILSVIDPIIHSRTFQVHLSHYVYERNSGAGEQRIAEYLAQAKAVLAKADAAFDNFSATALLADEKDLRERYRASYLALRQQGLQPLLVAAERNDDSAYDSAQHSVGELTRVFEKTLMLNCCCMNAIRSR